MKTIAIENLNRPLPRPLQVGYAASYFERLLGLMFRKSIGLEDALLLVQGRDSVLDSAIHMMFVPFDLAVVWINRQGRVVDVQLARAWRPAYWSKEPACYVLELHASRLGDFHIGDQVRIDDQAV